MLQIASMLLLVIGFFGLLAGLVLFCDTVITPERDAADSATSDR